MTFTLHAQPYDLAACGFYFESYEDYAEKAAHAVNDYGEPVEEFEIQFIDGEDIDCALASAIGLYQSNIAQLTSAYTTIRDPAIRAEFLRTVEAWAEDQWCIVGKG